MPAPDSPLIGVTGPDDGGWPAWIFTRLALHRAGARSVRITPSRPVAAEKLQGLVLGGGADVTQPLVPVPPQAKPRRSRMRWPRRALDLLLAPFVLLLRVIAGTRPHGVDHARDHLELGLLERARELDLPVLGICRGAQLMNVAEGGTLQHHVQSFYEERPQLYTVLPRREVEIEDGSRLHRVFGRARILVNSMHFHAVSEPGPGLRIVAREAAGTAQAIEHSARAFWIGVQWHPEYLPQQRSHQQLFIALVESAREARRAKPAAAPLPQRRAV
jgi:putative glutamine amidotransferase